MMTLRLHIIGSTVIKGKTYYLIEVAETDRKWVIRKRYSDFLALDKSLTSSGTLSHIALPEKGLFGFRHALGIGSFNERRLQSLSQYLMFLAQQVESSFCNNCLLDFLSWRTDDSGDTSSLTQPEIAVPSRAMPEPEVKLLQQIPLAVRIPTFTRSGPKLSKVQYTVIIECPGLSNTLTKQYGQLQELHSAMKSRPFGKSVPFLPSLKTFENLSDGSHDRLRVQLEAYLSFLFHHPLVLLDDALWNWIEASSIVKCVVSMVVTHALGDDVGLIRSIELLDELLSNGGNVKSCVSPAALVALTAPYRDDDTSDQTCRAVCRILKRLIVHRRVRNMVLSRSGAAGGTALLLKAYTRGGAVADAVQLVFEACGEDLDDKSEERAPSGLCDSFAVDSPSSGKTRLCCICLDKEVSHAFLPCGHYCACLDCAQYLHAQESACPVCRRTIQGQLQIFSS